MNESLYLFFTPRPTVGVFIMILGCLLHLCVLECTPNYMRRILPLHVCSVNMEGKLGPVCIRSPLRTSNISTLGKCWGIIQTVSRGGIFFAGACLGNWALVLRALWPAKAGRRGKNQIHSWPSEEIVFKLPVQQERWWSWTPPQCLSIQTTQSAMLIARLLILFVLKFIWIPAASS